MYLFLQIHPTGRAAAFNMIFVPISRSDLVFYLDLILFVEQIRDHYSDKPEFSLLVKGRPVFATSLSETEENELVKKSKKIHPSFPIIEENFDPLLRSFIGDVVIIPSCFSYSVRSRSREVYHTSFVYLDYLMEYLRIKRV